MAILVVGMLLSSFIVGCVHISNGPAQSPLIISLLWCIYNMVPQLLLLWYAFGTKSGRVITWLCQAAQLIGMGTAIAAIILIWPMIPPTYQYSETIGMQWEFYQSQQSGVLPSYNSIEWRGDSHTADAEAQVYDTRYYGNWTAYMEDQNDAFGEPADNTTTMDLGGGYYTGMAAGAWLLSVLSGGVALGGVLWRARVAAAGAGRARGGGCCTIALHSTAFSLSPSCHALTPLSPPLPPHTRTHTPQA